MEISRLFRFLILLVALGLAPVGAAAASLTASVDRNVVPAGESITLSLIFDGVDANAPPNLPAIANFRTGPSTGHRSEFVLDGGQSSMRHTFQYSLLATQPGETVIPAIRLVAGATTLTSQPIRVKVVTAADAAAAQASAASSLAFTRLVVPRNQVYLGEPFAVEVHLYYIGASDPQIQVRAEGFTLSPMQKPAQSQTMVGQNRYNLAVFRMVGRAARAGNLNLGPIEGTVTAFTRTDFFGRAVDARSVPLTSEVIPMQVLTLPKEGTPPGFNGTIGTYQLAFNAGPTNLAAGDPITVRVRISGRGPLDALTYPDQPDWRDFNTYPPTIKTELSDSLGLSGTKSFEQVIIPQNHEIKNLPPFRFSFFDPQAKQYRTLTGPTIALNIRPGSGPSAPLPVLTNANDTAANGPREDDVIHIRPHLELVGAATPLLLRPRFLALQGAPVVLWIALLLRRRHRESLANNPRRRRQLEVAQRIRDGVQELKATSAAGESNEFFALLFRLLQEQIGERLDLPSSAITESVIEERLRDRELPPESTKSLQELFQSCNQARYAPVRDRQELAAFIPKLESILRDLQALKP